MKRLWLIAGVIGTFLSSWAVMSFACTNILVSKGASKDSSVIITYSCDGEFVPHLRYTPAQDHKPGEFLEFRDGKGTIHKIPQPAHTYAVIGLMNEYQLAIG
ncbi:MAG: dipeptidase, partial [Calditrichaeota bacterium]|nr:dipeptidase [Calditrichota bacterium]